MSKYLSNLLKNLRIGITSYTENKTVLSVIGKVGIGTFDAKSALDVVVPSEQSKWFLSYGDVGIHTSDQYFSGVAFDSVGDIYASGADGTNGVPYVIKFSNSGTIVWQKFFEHSDPNKNNNFCETIAVDKSTDDLYTAVHTNDVVNGITLVKLNSSGDILWQNEIDDVQNEVPTSIGIGTTGNVHLVGLTSSYGSGNNDALIIKFDSFGNQLWQKVVGDVGSDSGNAVAVDSVDNVYVVGTAYTTGSNDAFVIKFDSSGNELWQKTIGDVNVENGFSVAVDSTDNVYITGDTELLGPSNPSQLIVKLDSSGTELWQRIINGDSYDGTFGIAIDSSDIVYVVGHQKNDEIAITSFNSSGDVLWKKELKDRTNGQLGQDYNRPTKIIDVKDGKLIVGGYITNIENHYNSNAFLMNVPTELGNVIGAFSDYITLRDSLLDVNYGVLPIGISSLTVLTSTVGVSTSGLTTLTTPPSFGGTVDYLKPYSILTNGILDTNFLETENFILNDVPFGKTNADLNNFIVGSGAGYDVTTGSSNIMFGNSSGHRNTSGSDNNFLGYRSGYYNTIGCKNNFLGNQSGYFNDSGCNNNFIGDSTGYCNVSGNFNNFFGFQVGSYNNDGSYNNFIGSCAGYSNVSGSCNNFLGCESGFNNTSGTNNNFIGSGSGYHNTSGTSNNFIGVGAGRSNTTGSCNNFLGCCAGFNNIDGDNNNFFGTKSGFGHTIGSSNNYIGNFAGSYSSGGSYNNFIGQEAGSYTTSSCNNFFGSFAGFYNSTGQSNNFFGNNSGYSNIGGSYNNFLGSYSGYGNTTGCYNIFIGHRSGYGNTIGSYNNFFGCYSGYCNTGNCNLIFGNSSGYTNNGNCNILIGNNVGYANSGCLNIFVGRSVGYGNSGSYNNFFGNYSGYCNIGNCNNFFGLRSGYYNTGSCNNFFGYDSGCCNSGCYNNFFGYQSGIFNSADLNNFFGKQAGYCNTTGSCNIFFGVRSGYYNTSGCNNNFLGSSSGYYNTLGSYNNFFGSYVGISTLASRKVILGSGSSSNLFDVPEFDKDKQFAVGLNSTGTAEYWLVGNENFDIGIGITNPTSKLTVGGDVLVSGIVTASNFVGSLTGIAASTVQLVNPRTFEITGHVVASPVSFDGTGNVSLAATIQPNSVGLGTDTFGDYVQTISGTANEIDVAGGTGEGSTPVISFAPNPTIGGNVTVGNDLQINNNLNVSGNITIGGTAAYIIVNEFRVKDADIVAGFTTDINNNEVSSDTTANHGGIAVASTEGNPLVTIYNPDIGETNPATYKKIMWFKSGSFAGLNTDAWLINYAVGIGSTQFPAGTRLAAGSVQFSEYDLSVVRNINASGIVTGNTFRPSSGYIQAADGANSFYIYSGTGNVAFQGTIGASQINNGQGYKALDFGTTTTPSVNITNTLLVGAAGTVITTTNNGFVGIGVTNPQTKLQVGGVIGFNDTNIRIGDNTTGAKLTSGTNNFFAGVGAGNSTTIGSSNNFFGYCSGYCNTTGVYNNFFGYYAGRHANGCHNNFLGAYSGCINTGKYNNFFGFRAGRINTTGKYNNFFGAFSGEGSTGGCYNNFFGVNSGHDNTGNRNNFIGVEAGFGNTSGSSNNFIGVYAGKNNETGSCNIFIGRKSGDGNGTGSNNIFLGNYTGLSYSASRKVIFGFGSSGNLFDSPDIDKDTQLAVGIRTDANPSKYWIVGNENFNIGIGTTNPQTKLEINGVLGFGTFYAYSQTRTNIKIGDNTTGASLTSGYDNIFMGVGAGNSTTTGFYNNFLGRNAGYNNTTGSRNNFFGQGAGQNNINGTDNIFFGDEAGICNTSGSWNVFIGARAGERNTTGSSNIFIGNESGRYTIGNKNILLGDNLSSTDVDYGSHNKFFGSEIARYNTTGSHNNFFGTYAAYRNTTGSNNNFFGTYAGYNNTTGSRNNFFGRYSGRNNTQGTDNIFFGSFTGISTSASNKIIFGRGFNTSNLFDAPDTTKDTQFAVGVRTDANPANYWIVGNENFNIGIGTTNPTTKLQINGVLGFGTFYAYSQTRTNIKIGDNTTGANLTSGYGNIFMGVGAGNSTTAGYNNNFFGHQAGYKNTNGYDNNFFGDSAGYSNIDGSSNNFFGKDSGSSNTYGGYNNFFGWRAGWSNTTGYNNNFFGDSAGGNNTTGINNIAIGGFVSGYSNTIGNNNIYLGAHSGISTSASNKIIFGGGFNFSNRFDAPDPTKDIQLAIGVRTDANPANYWIVGNENFNIGIGTTNPTSKLTVGGDGYFSGIVTATDFNSASDVRLKENISVIDNPLDKIIKLEGVNFNWKSTGKKSLGVIAQEVEKVLPELVYGEESKTVNYNGIIGLLIECVKKQQEEIDELRRLIDK